MKSKEEIEQLLTDVYGSSISIIGKELFVKGYTHCQKDMVEKYTEQDMIKFAFDTYYQEDMAKKYTEEDLRQAMICVIVSNTIKGSKDIDDYINSLNKQD